MESSLLLTDSLARDNEDDNDARSNIGTRYNMEQYFQLVHYENVEETVFVARDPPSPALSDMEFGILLVMDTNKWGDVFIRRHSAGYVPPDEDELMHDEFNELYHPWD
jgi:hypothetical protein